MKGKAVVTRGIPDTVIRSLGGMDFIRQLLTKVIAEHLGAENPHGRPAEYYVQEPDYTVMVKHNVFGVEFRLTGVTRNGRTAAQIHKALRATHALVRAAIQLGLKAAKPACRVQMFCVIMLDAAIETAPGSRAYSNVIESDAEWVTAAE